MVMKNHAAKEFTQDFRRRTPEEVCFFGTYGYWPEDKRDSAVPSNDRAAMREGSFPSEREESATQRFFPRSALKQASFTTR